MARRKPGLCTTLTSGSELFTISPIKKEVALTLGITELAIAPVDRESSKVHRLKFINVHTSKDSSIE
jgi:hypothetical protein